MTIEYVILIFEPNVYNINIRVPHADVQLVPRNLFPDDRAVC